MKKILFLPLIFVFLLPIINAISISDNVTFTQSGTTITYRFNNTPNVTTILLGDNFITINDANISMTVNQTINATINEVSSNYNNLYELLGRFSQALTSNTIDVINTVYTNFIVKGTAYTGASTPSSSVPQSSVIPQQQQEQMQTMELESYKKLKERFPFLFWAFPTDDERMKRIFGETIVNSKSKLIFLLDDNGNIIGLLVLPMILLFTVLSGAVPTARWGMSRIKY